MSGVGQLPFRPLAALCRTRRPGCRLYRQWAGGQASVLDSGLARQLPGDSGPLPGGAVADEAAPSVAVRWQTRSFVWGGKSGLEWPGGVSGSGFCRARLLPILALRSDPRPLASAARAAASRILALRRLVAVAGSAARASASARPLRTAVVLCSRGLRPLPSPSCCALSVFWTQVRSGSCFANTCTSQKF